MRSRTVADSVAPRGRPVASMMSSSGPGLDWWEGMAEAVRPAGLAAGSAEGDDGAPGAGDGSWLSSREGREGGDGRD